jgi:hypothetical protein
MDISTREDLRSTRVYRETVMIEDIIVFEDMFPDIKISSFDLFLYGGDIFREHTTLDERISLWM